MKIHLRDTSKKAEDYLGSPHIHRSIVLGYRASCGAGTYAAEHVTDDPAAVTCIACKAKGSALLPSIRDKAVWRAALTLAHNLCVQSSDRLNDDDGPLEVVDALTGEAKRIRGWLEPTDEQLIEMFTEAGVLAMPHGSF